MSAPSATVWSADGDSPAAASSVPLPAIFTAPIRTDVVQQVHSAISLNKRQPYCVNKYAGKMPSAASWGTGRAVSRIPRVQGGGTHRSGQGAFGNMCRGGRMFSPTKTWRKWHRKINLTQKRYAVASAVAASGVPALVMARGHRIGATPEGPLVVSSATETISKTSAAVAMLTKLGAYEDVDKVLASKTMRAGKGKMRNRRFVQRRGPLIVYGNDGGLTRAFRNIPGVELADVKSLNLLQLAPGGHVGRFCIWTEGAFSQLDAIFGTHAMPSTEKLHNGNPYRLPSGIMANADLSRLINSDEIQSKVNPPKAGTAAAVLKVNPLKVPAAMESLNPAAAKARSAATAAGVKSGAIRKRPSGAVAKAKKAYYKAMVAE
jgi:large subunit ribosomal protein L4e